MVWIFVVLILALVWVLVRQNRPQPAARGEKELPDPQDLLVGRLTELAEAAREDGRHADAQAAELKIAWLKTRPLLGHDDPPAALDANERKHLRLARDIWERCGAVLADDAQPYAGCKYRPESMLPYPKDYLAQALDLLVAVGEGRVRSIHFHADAVPADVLDSMRQARERLAAFVDVPAAELPRDPEANARYGAERGW